MSRLAALLMFVSWLLYGAMPATGMPMNVSVPTTNMDHWVHGAAPEDNKPQPCPRGGKSCVTPFCAACLTLLPDIGFDSGPRFTFVYPAPATVRAYLADGPAPLDPPPRS